MRDISQVNGSIVIRVLVDVFDLHPLWFGSEECLRDDFRNEDSVAGLSVGIVEVDVGSVGGVVLFLDLPGFGVADSSEVAYLVVVIVGSCFPVFHRNPSPNYRSTPV